MLILPELRWSDASERWRAAERLGFLDVKDRRAGYRRAKQKARAR